MNQECIGFLDSIKEINHIKAIWHEGLIQKSDFQSQSWGQGDLSYWSESLVWWEQKLLKVRSGKTLKSESSTCQDENRELTLSLLYVQEYTQGDKALV